jgi:hypothetical protein
MDKPFFDIYFILFLLSQITFLHLWKIYVTD